MVAKSSYGAAAQEISELFADYLDGDAGRPALVLGAHAPTDAVRNALEKSLEAFGFGSHACTFAALVPFDEAAEGGDIALDAQALFLLVEGIDPLFVVAVDESAAVALGHAFRASYPPDAPIRVFGRSGAAFSNLNALLQTERGKQKAWRILKTLQVR